MGIWKKVSRSNFLIKLRSWEYWPFWIVHLPAMVYWLYLSARSGSLVFFSASNPGIPMGGMFGESKFDILKKIPARYIPRTILISLPASPAGVSARLREEGMNFPLVFKPDIGERGFMVQIISSEEDIALYLQRVRCSFIVQDYVRGMEFGVFYRRFPHEHSGKVTSVVVKETLSVRGDGVSAIKDLIMNHDRAKLQWAKLKITHRDHLGCVPPDGRVVELVPLGNHVLGAKFLNGNHLVNDALNGVIDTISKSVTGFNIGRFDLKCSSVADLYRGDFRIMELNGCGAEPAHIYDPAFSFWEGMGVLLDHWKQIFIIAQAHKSQGVNFLSHREALAYYRRFRNATR